MNAKDYKNQTLTVIDGEKSVHSEVETNEEKLRCANLASFGVMTSNLAHKLNNPLAILLGQAGKYQLFKDKDRLTTENIDNMFSIIDSTAKRIAEMVQELGHFCNEIKDGEISQTPVRKIFEIVSKHASERFETNEIDFQVSGEQEVEIECNATQVAQVILNLLDNSFESLFNLSNDKWINLSSEIISDAEIQIVIEISNHASIMIDSANYNLRLWASKAVVKNLNGLLYFDNARLIITLPI